MFEESVAIFRALDNPAETSDALNDLAWCLRGLGKIRESRQVLDEAIVLARQSGALERIVNVLALLGKIDDIEVRYAEAEAESYFREALELAAQTENVYSQIEAILGLANLLAQSRQLERAVEWLAMTMTHPRMVKELHCIAEKSLLSVQNELPPDIFAAADQRGRALDLDTVVTECLSGEHFFLAGST